MSGESPGIIAATGSNNSKLENLDEGSADAVQVHIQPPRPFPSQTLLRQGNETGLTSISRLDNDTSNTRACDRPVTRRRDRSDDERRLLGDYEKDPDAVPITRPRNSNWHDRMTSGVRHTFLHEHAHQLTLGQVVQGGPRPTNTLGSVGSTLKRIGDDIRGVARHGINTLKRSHQGGYHRGLDIVTSSGDNVVNGAKVFDLHTDRNQEPATKKPRTSANPTVQSNYRHPTRMADDDDTVMFEKEKFGRFPPIPRKSSYNSSLLGQGSEAISNSHSIPGRTAGVHNQEFLEVEKIMSPHPKSRRRRSRNSQPGTVNSSTTPQVTIDLSADDHDSPQPKQPYRGTARETKSRRTSTSLVQERHRNDLHAKETETKSRHFPATNKPKISSSMRSSNGPRSGQQAEQSNRCTSFVNDRGKRRNSLMGDSPDELQNRTTVGSHSHELQFSPTHISRGSRKPLGDIIGRPVTPPRQVSDLPESNITRTEFTSSGRRSRKINRVEEGPKARIQIPGWGVGLATFRTGRVDLAGRASCGLVYDAKKELFVVKHQGKDLYAENAEFSVNPRRVAHILMGEGDSCKLRLFLSRSANSDHRTDIELGTHKNVFDLVQRIQEIAPGINVNMSDKMDQIFEGRLSEVDPQLLCNNQSNIDPGEDIQLLEAKESRKKAKAGLVEPGTEVSSKRPSRDIIVDANDNFETISIPVDHRSPRESSHPLQREIVAGHNRQDGSNIHQKQSSNQHQTRSRIQQSAGGNPLPTKPSPPEARYSKVYGLGSPWPKPLVFPHTGKRKATVEWKDLQRLDEGEFLNDNLLGFYLRYLEYELEQKNPGLAQQIYFFNTYFFASLTNTPKGKKGINYEAVQKWTRTVDIFAYDYVVVPINESAHWYVAIICNLPALDRSLEADDETDLQPAVRVALSSDNVSSVSSPAPSNSVVDDIDNKAALSDLVADDTRNSFAEMNLEGKKGSMLEDGFSHRPNEEWREGDESLERPLDLDQATAEALPSTAQESKNSSPSSVKKGRRKSTPRLQKYESGSPIIIILDSLGLSHSPTVRILKDYLAQEGKAKRSLEYPDDAIKGMTAKGIPLQNNYCDCGLYLLGYLDKLVLDPQELCHKILQRELDAEVDWPSLNPSQIRDQIRFMIQELQKEQVAERKENAKKNGKYIYRGHVEPTTGPEAPEPSLLGTLTTADAGPGQASKPSRESALKSATPIDQDPHSRVKTVKQPPAISVKPSLEGLNLKDKVAESAIPTSACQEDSPVFLGAKPVRKEGSGSQEMKRPMGGSKENRVHASENPTVPSPRKFFEKVEILSSNPTPDDSEMLGV